MVIYSRDSLNHVKLGTVPTWTYISKEYISWDFSLVLLEGYSEEEERGCVDTTCQDYYCAFKFKEKISHVRENGSRSLDI